MKHNFTNHPSHPHAAPLNPITIMSTKLSDLTLVRATPGQVLESRKRTFVQWSRGKTMTEFLERDRLLDGREHAQTGKMTTWYVLYE